MPSHRNMWVVGVVLVLLVSLSVIGLRFQHGRQVFVSHADSRSLLQYVQSDDEGAIKAELTKGLTSEQLDSMLLQAITAQKTSIAELLLEHGANPNLEASSLAEVRATGGTPLIMAVLQGNLPLVQALVAHGADVNLEGGPVLFPGGATGYTSPLSAACATRDIEIGRFLVKHGADVNQQIGTLTTLNLAVEAGNSEIVSFLLSSGAKPGLLDFEEAHDDHHPAIFRLLQKADPATEMFWRHFEAMSRTKQ